MQHLASLVDVVGAPSPKRLEVVSQKRDRGGDVNQVTWIRRSTLDDYLRGKRRKVPGWPLVRELLVVCRKIAEEDGFVWLPDVLGTEAEWQALWDAARHGIAVTESPIRLAELDRPALPLPRAVAPESSAPSSDDKNGPAVSLSGGLEKAWASKETPSAESGHLRSSEADNPGITTPAVRTVHAPELGEEGGWVTITRWHRGLGERICIGEHLVDVDTETMLTLELPSPASGTIEKILAVQHDMVLAGQPLCVIRISSEAERMSVPES